MDGKLMFGVVIEEFFNYFLADGVDDVITWLRPMIASLDNREGVAIVFAGRELASAEIAEHRAGYEWLLGTDANTELSPWIVQAIRRRKIEVLMTAQAEDLGDPVAHGHQLNYVIYDPGICENCIVGGLEDALNYLKANLDELGHNCARAFTVSRRDMTEAEIEAAPII